MKKLLVILATMGLVFQLGGCKAKKAQDDTEIVENADVEKIEAEEAYFNGDEFVVENGPVDESLQAALGETPADGTNVEAAPTDTAVASTEIVGSENQASNEIQETPALDENTLSAEPSQEVAALENPPAPETVAADTGIYETPIVETPVEAPMETPVAAETSLAPMETPVLGEVKATTPAASTTLKKIAETEPYAFGEGFVNTVYIARPKEKLKDISQTIYGTDRTKELKQINPQWKKTFAGGEKIYYISPNRPTDSSRMISFYEDTGMVAETYVAQKGDNLKKVSKNLLGYDNAWKEVWTTNAVASKSSLAEGETLKYWKPATAPVSIAQNSAAPQLVDNVQQLPAQPQQLAQNPPPPAEPQMTQELPPPPPMPEEPQQLQQPADLAMEQPQQDLQMPPPPPMPEAEVVAAPAAPSVKAHNMEDEPATEEGAANDTTMILGVVVVLVALLAFVLVRKNKRKKEADMASIEQNHVGT